MNKKVKKALTLALAIVLVLIALVALVWGGLNLIKFPLYSDYYSVKSDFCTNPGLGDGFVCQGIGISDDGKNVLVSGYMTDDSCSRIYITDTDNNSYYVSLNRNGKDFDGHCGGISINGNTVYMVDGGEIFTISLEALLNAEDGDIFDIGDGIEINNAGSSLFVNDKYLYVGEFHNGNQYVTEHIYETPNGTNHAIVTRYSLDDLTAPERVYSIRDEVQGICFTPDGKIVMSTSYGLADSGYYVYDESKATDSGHTLDGAPVYYLSAPEKEMKGPAMSEGLDYYDGKILALTESASNKYIFGKFFFANKIVALDLLG